MCYNNWRAARKICGKYTPLRSKTLTKKLYFDTHFGIDFYALCEDGQLCEYSAQSSAVPDAVGNIYKGRVTAVLNGMQAAFVDCGLERHCYISVADMVTDGKLLEGDVDIPTELNLNVGDEILVQVTKPAVDKKGAKVTTKLSFTGKYIVYMPDTPFVGISKRFADKELIDNLAFSAKKFLCGDEGMIVRSAAPYALLGEKIAELNYFRNAYSAIKENFDGAKSGELLYSASPVYARILRDVMLTPADEIHVGCKELFSAIESIVETYPEREKPELFLHDEHEDMLYAEGISDEIIRATKPAVELPNGANITVNRTEALTVIDVNTGKFTGKDSLESTVFATNVFAAKEIARQVRLRNLGGIFVVDFIDMKEDKHKKAIVQELERAFKNDKGRCKVLPMSQFGLVEFTRKRTDNNKSCGNIVPCRCCDGYGYVRSDFSVACEFRAKLLEILHGGERSVCADLNFDVVDYISNYPEFKENIMELYPDARIALVPHRTFKTSAIRFRNTHSPDYTLPDGATELF